MDAALIERIETNVERIAAALFAGAVGYAAYRLLEGGFSQLQLGGLAAAAAVLAYAASVRALRTVTPPKPQFAVPIFNVSELEDELLLTEVVGDELLLTDRANRDELLLTDADRLEPALTAADPLVLDDILAELGPDSRVVRLFDRKAMPTPGQLKSRIDSHLSEGEPRSGASDASQALSDALAELRRSLR